MNYWEFLGIEPTADRNVIREAYMNKLSEYNPEDDPEGFQKLREAYENALKQEVIEEAEEEELTPVDEFMKKVESLYDNFFERIKVDNWKELLKEDVCFQLDTSNEISHKLLEFFMEKNHVPTAVWEVLNDYFQWTEKEEELKEKFPAGFIHYLYANINGRFNLNYDLFKEGENIDYDEFIKNYYDGDYFVYTTNIYESKRCIDKAMEIAPYHEDLKILKSRYLFKIDEVHKAIETLSEVIEENPQCGEGYFLRAQGYLRIGEVEKSLQDYEKSLEIVPNAPASMKGAATCNYALGNMEEAKKYYYKLNLLYEYDENIKSRLKSANEYLIEEKEQEKGADFSLADDYFQNEKYEDVIRVCKELEKNPEEDRNKLYTLMGYTFYYLKDLEKALEYFDKALELNENNGEALGGKAGILQDIHRREEALTLYNKAIENNYALDTMYNNKGSLLYELERFEEALECCNKSLEFNRGMAHAYKNKAKILCELSRYEEALGACEDALNISPKMSSAYAVKARIYNKISRSEEALKICNEAIENGTENEELYYEKGEACYSLEKMDEAIEAYEKAVEINENLTEAYIGIGHSWYVKKDYNKAIEYYDKAIEQEPEKPDYYMYKADAYKVMKDERDIEWYTRGLEAGDMGGYLYFKRGRAYAAKDKYNEAIEDFKKAIEISPEQSQAYNELGRAYNELREYKKAIEYYDKAIEIDPSGYEYYYADRGIAYRNLGDIERAIEEYKKALEISSDYPFVYDELGEVYHEKKEYKEAIKWYTKALECDPEYAYCLANRGLTYLNMDEKEKAIEDYNKAADIYPNYTYAWNQLGEIYYEMNELDKAMEKYRKAIESDPDFGDGYNNLGVCYLDKNEYDEALKIFFKGIEVAPNHKYFYFNIAKINQIRQNYETSEEYYKKALEKDEDYAACYYNLSKIYYNKDELEKALDYAKESIDRSENPNASYYNQRGLVYMDMKKHAAALNDFKKALEINPKGLFIKYNIGVLNYNIEKYKIALEIFEGLLKIEPDESAYYMAGQCYEKLGQIEKAVESYTKGIDHDVSQRLLFARGLGYKKLGMKKEAQNDFKQVLKINPNNENAKKELKKKSKFFGLFN